MKLHKKKISGLLPNLNSEEAFKKTDVIIDYLSSLTNLAYKKSIFIFPRYNGHFMVMNFDLYIFQR